jgi:hypothetical protein
MNIARAKYQKEPIDYYNMGYEYSYDGNYTSFLLANIYRERFVVISNGAEGPLFFWEYLLVAGS